MIENRDMHKDFIAALARVAVKYGKLMKIPIDMGEGEKLTATEAHTIDAVGKNYGNTVSGLAKLFSITKGAVSQVIHKLETRGYIEKHRDEDNWKEKPLTLTARGLKAFDLHTAMHEEMDGIFMKKLDRLNDEKFEEYRELFCLIEESIDLYLAKDR